MSARPGGPDASLLDMGSSSRGVVAPSGVGMKSSSGVRASDSSSVGGVERVTGGGVGGSCWFCNCWAGAGTATGTLAGIGALASISGGVFCGATGGVGGSDCCCCCCCCTGTGCGFDSCGETGVSV